MDPLFNWLLYFSKFLREFKCARAHDQKSCIYAYMCSFQLLFLKGARARLKGVTGVLGGCVSGSNFLYRCMIVEIFFV